MPKPNTGEHQQDFLKRCMGDAEANSSFPNMSQRYAFCNSQWNNNHKKMDTVTCPYCDEETPDLEVAMGYIKCQKCGKTFSTNKKHSAMKNIIEDIYREKDFTSIPSFKEIDGKKGIVTGYFADFNTIDSDGDIIKQGAFTKTIAATGPNSPKPRIKHLMNHSVSQPLGVIQTLKEDSKGLYYESKIGNHALGVDFIKMAESGLITEHSIGYRTLKYTQVMPWEDWKEGEAARELTELKLYEGSSLTAWGANPNTPLTGLKGLNQTELNKLINRAEAVEKFCRDSTATDETIEMLLLYSKQLLQVIADNVITTEGDVEGSNTPSTVLAIVPDEPLIKVDSVVECPCCAKHTYNTQAEKGYIKCHRCNAMFNYGSKLFVKL